MYPKSGATLILNSRALSRSLSSRLPTIIVWTISAKPSKLLSKKEPQKATNNRLTMCPKSRLQLRTSHQRNYSKSTLAHAARSSPSPWITRTAPRMHPQMKLVLSLITIGWTSQPKLTACRGRYMRNIKTASPKDPAISRLWQAWSAEKSINKSRKSTKTVKITIQLLKISKPHPFLVTWSPPCECFHHFNERLEVVALSRDRQSTRHREKGAWTQR